MDSAAKCRCFLVNVRFWDGENGHFLCFLGFLGVFLTWVDHQQTSGATLESTSTKWTDLSCGFKTGCSSWRQCWQKNLGGLGGFPLKSTALLSPNVPCGASILHNLSFLPVPVPSSCTIAKTRCFCFSWLVGVTMTACSTCQRVCSKVKGWQRLSQSVAWPIWQIPIYTALF